MQNKYSFGLSYKDDKDTLCNRGVICRKEYYNDI